MKKIMCMLLLLFLINSCNSSPRYNLKSAGSILIFKKDQVTYTVEYKEYTDNSLTFYVSIKNDTDKEYPLYIKKSDYISSVIIDDATVYDTIQYVWYYGDIKYEDDDFNMTINLSNEGEKVFNSMCDFNIEDAYIPTGPASTQKAHYIDVLLNH